MRIVETFRVIARRRRVVAALIIAGRSSSWS
jgi:hypothetical protein